MNSDSQAEGSALPSSLDLLVLLPRFIIRRMDGLYADVSMPEARTEFTQFVERVFAADALFSDLDYPLFLKLYYEPEAAELMACVGGGDSGHELRFAQDIVAFAPERRPIYHQVKISPDGSMAEYLFEPVALETTTQEPVFGPPEEDGTLPILSYEAKSVLVSTRLDPDEFVAAMWAKGVRFGIDIKAVAEAIAGDESRRLEICHWQLAVAGNDAGIAEQTDLLHRNDAPKELANGRIDLRQFKNHFPQVMADTRLLKKTPRSLGALGWKVSGLAIEPGLPKDFDIETLAGPGTRVERTAEGEFIVAAITGFISIDGKSNQISIDEKIVSRHGVSLRTTGDLSLSGADFEEHGEVQERRQVKGHNMTFLADVFGEVVSDGGIINLKQGLAGGSVHNPGGGIVITGTASRAVIEARGGEIVIASAESCLVIGSKVRLGRAVNCEVLAEDVTVESCEGCAVAGRQVTIVDAGSRRDIETVVTVLLPDDTAWNREIEALGSKSAETAKTREKMEQAVAQISEKPEVKRFLMLSQKVEAKAAALNAEQEAAWKVMQARFAAVKRQLDQLRGEIGALAERQRLLGERVAAIEEARAQAAARPSCALNAVTGDTVVRKMKVAPEGFPLEALPVKQIHKLLRSHGDVQDHLFSGSSGSFSWAGQKPDMSDAVFDRPADG